MLPNTDIQEEDNIEEDMTEETIPEKTYKLNFENKTIEGYVDDIEARQQAIKAMLMTTAETYPIYDAGYGVILDDLIGEKTNFAISEAKDRIEEAILQDERFESVTFNDPIIKGKKVTLSFTVTCVDGDEVEMEGVDVDV